MIKKGDIVLVSDFDGDFETIGVKAIFDGMSEDGKFITRPIEPGKYKKDFVSWRYCKEISED